LVLADSIGYEGPILFSFGKFSWKLLEIAVAELLQAGCRSCHPTNSVIALKDAIFGVHPTTYNISLIYRRM